MPLSSAIRDILDSLNPPPGFSGAWDRSDPKNPVFSEVPWGPRDDAWLGAEIAKAIVDFVESATLNVVPPAASGATATPPGPFAGSVGPGFAAVGDGGSAMARAFGTALPASGAFPADDLSIAAAWADGLGASLSTLLLEFSFSGTTMLPAPPGPPVPTPVSGYMAGRGVVAPGIPQGLSVLAAGIPSSRSNADTANAIAGAAFAILGACTAELASLPPLAGVAAAGSVQGWQ